MTAVFATVDDDPLGLSSIVLGKPQRLITRPQLDRIVSAASVLSPSRDQVSSRSLNGSIRCCLVSQVADAVLREEAVTMQLDPYGRRTHSMLGSDLRNRPPLIDRFE